MTSLYTTEVAKMFNEAKAPYRGFVMDVIERQDQLSLVIYKDNLSRFTNFQQQALAAFAIDLVKRLQNITTITLEVERHARADGSIS
jgi:hypothetical protein